LIRYGGFIPIGAFSPTSLVYTATKYNTLLRNEDFSLRDADGYLCPPEEREEIEHVGEWLINLQKRLNAVMFSAQTNPDHKTIVAINDLIDDWLKEIRSALSLKGEEEIDVKGVKLSEDYTKPESAAFIEKYRVYQLLLHPLQKDEKEIAEEGKGHSDIALSLRPERNYSGFKEVVVITEHLLATNVRVWEPRDHAPIYLRDLGGNAKACIEKYFDNKEGWGKEIKGHAHADLGQEEAIWIRPEKYFLTDIMLKAKNGTFLSESEYEYNSGKIPKPPYILPFRKEILNFFSPDDFSHKDDLNKILKPKYKQDGDNIEFSFNLPIGTDKKPIEIKKVYKSKGAGPGEGMIVGVDVPVIEIFPNYLDQHWRRYYIFQASGGNITVAPIVFGKGNDSPRPAITSREHEDRELGQKIKITEISGDNAFPEGLEIKDAAGREAGLVIIQHQPEGDLSREWRVGIDLGTSNTNIFK
jgi:hypothetical protein